MFGTQLRTSADCHVASGAQGFSFAGCNFPRYSRNFGRYGRIFALLDKTANPLARLLPRHRASGVLCRSRFRHSAKDCFLCQTCADGQSETIPCTKEGNGVFFQPSAQRWRINQITHNEHTTTSASRRTLSRNLGTVLRRRAIYPRTRFTRRLETQGRSESRQLSLQRRYSWRMHGIRRRVRAFRSLGI